jgi:hypothetical protein
MIAKILFFMLLAYSIYYAIVIGFDLYKVNLAEDTDEAQKDEVEIDIEDEVNNFCAESVERDPERHSAGTDVTSQVAGDIPNEEIAAPMMTDGYAVEELLELINLNSTKENADMDGIIYTCQEAA